MLFEKPVHDERTLAVDRAGDRRAFNILWYLQVIVLLVANFANHSEDLIILTMFIVFCMFVSLAAKVQYLYDNSIPVREIARQVVHRLFYTSLLFAAILLIAFIVHEAS